LPEIEEDEFDGLIKDNKKLKKNDFCFEMY